MTRPDLHYYLWESGCCVLAPGIAILDPLMDPTTLAQTLWLLEAELDAVDEAGGNDRGSQARQARGGQN
jgi:hypothetical protein